MSLGSWLKETRHGFKALYQEMKWDHFSNAPYRVVLVIPPEHLANREQIKAKLTSLAGAMGKVVPLPQIHPDAIALSDFSEHALKGTTSEFMRQRSDGDIKKDKPLQGLVSRWMTFDKSKVSEKTMNEYAVLSMFATHAFPSKQGGLILVEERNTHKGYLEEIHRKNMEREH